MKDARHKEIIQILKYKTENQSIYWDKDTSSSKFSVEVPIKEEKKYKVTLFRIDDEHLYSVQSPGSISAELTFLDENEMVFDTIRVYNTSSSDFKELSVLYDLAKQSANGATQKLDEIIGGLKELNMSSEN